MTTATPPPKPSDCHRIVSWNVAGGFPQKFDRLESLDPDVAVVGEACTEERLRSAGIDRFASYASQGPRPHKCLAVIGFGDTTAAPVANVDERIEYLIPCRVEGAIGYTLFGTWAQIVNSTGHRTENWELSHGMLLDTYPHLLGEGPCVIAGDMNHHVRWDKGRAGWDFSGVVAAYGQHDLHNAWHRVNDAEQGDASEPPTFWLQWNQAKPDMIDYCFVPGAWTSRIRNVWIGDYENWCAKRPGSDHAPMVVDIEVPPLPDDQS